MPVPPSARKHKKRHSVNRERSHEQCAAASASRRKATSNAAEHRRKKQIVSDYFAGRVADLSGLADA